MQEELIMVNAAGIFYATLEWKVVAHIITVIHERCTYLKIMLCWDQHVKPLLQKTMTQLLQLKSLLYRCLSNLTLRPKFKRDCDTTLQNAEMHIITATKMLIQTECSYFQDLKAIFKKLKHILSSKISAAPKYFANISEIATA